MHIFLKIIYVHEKDLLERVHQQLHFNINVWDHNSRFLVGVFETLFSYCSSVSSFGIQRDEIFL